MTLSELCSLHGGVFSSWRSAAGWEMQEEAVLSLPASEAGRPDGSNSALSDIAQWGSAATGSDGKDAWRECILKACVSNFIDTNYWWID